MKLYVLDLGRIIMENDNPVTKEDGTQAQKPQIPIHAFLIDSPAGYILFDAGCDPLGMKGAWPKEMCANPFVYDENQTLEKQLDTIYVKMEDVRYIVLSHLHLDHAGAVHLFPNAEVYASKEELEAVYAGHKDGSIDIFHQKSDFDNWNRANVNWKPVSGDQKPFLCDGIELLDLGKGHSFGMLALALCLKEGCKMLVADAAYSAIHYGPPPQMAGVCCDEEGYFAALEKIRSYADAHHAEVLFGHDMPQFVSLKKAPQYYE